ncbi:MAG: epoxyqueuosine reductase [Deltaproteobacteria bacterium]|nr:epoxyqueuosine reductase [Deltaproteobacteria bacterium]
MSKENIRKYGLDLGIDVVGFTSIEDYRSERSPDPRTILPDVKSIVVFGHRMIDGALDSKNMRVAMMARMGVMDTSKSHLYLMARFIEDKYKTKTAPVLSSYPLDMEAPAMGLIGDVSLRHAAVSAGLGAFGRHNLVIHPRYGSRLSFTALLTELPLPSDPPVTEDLCNFCNLCVESCPGRALDTEKRTEDLKCLRVSQPYGIGGAFGYIRRFLGKSPEEQLTVLKEPRFMSLYQASFIGFHYHCFNCIAVCPIDGRK